MAVRFALTSLLVVVRATDNWVMNNNWRAALEYLDTNYLPEHGTRTIDDLTDISLKQWSKGAEAKTPGHDVSGNHHANGPGRPGTHG